MLSSNKLYPVFVTQICSAIDMCQYVFDPEKKRPRHVSQIMVVGNNICAEKLFKERKYLLNTFRITVFLKVQENTHPVLVQKNCNFWNEENADIYLFLPNKFNSSVCSGSKILKYNLELLENRIMHVISGGQNDDWYVIQEANEIIRVPPNIANVVTSVREFLLKVSQEIHNFNAISVSTLYMTDLLGISYKEMPFKVHTVGPWDRWQDDKVKSYLPKVNTFNGTVKIWKKTDSKVRVSYVKSRANGMLFSEVLFSGRTVFPYTLLSMRYHPNIRYTLNINDIGNISEKIHLMYGYYFYTGYWNYARKSMIETDILF